MTPKKLYTSLLICTIISIGFISLLFAFTKKELKRDQSFVRRFQYYAPEKTHELDLEYNRYYIAGVDDNKIYLGNSKSPLYLIALDSTLQNKQEIHLTIDRDSLPLRSPKVRVIPPHFFLMDGSVPFILRGRTKDWKAHFMLKDPLYFVNAEPMDSVTLAIRTINKETKEFALGTIQLSDSTTKTLSDNLLQKQVDGFFDVDGTLQYNRQQQQLVYTYFYRNQYIIANNNLKLQHRGNTIDTISRAQIQVGHIASKNQKKMAAPALIVNKYSATSGNYLFVNSNLLSANESLDLWEKSSIIDVYDMVKNQYEFSFRIENIGKSKLRAFHVVHDKFIGLIGNHIVTYQLGKRFKEVQTPITTIQKTNPKIQISNSKNNTVIPVKHTAVRAKTENL